MGYHIILKNSKDELVTDYIENLDDLIDYDPGPMPPWEFRKNRRKKHGK